MSQDLANRDPALSRRALLGTTGGALSGIALGFAGLAQAGKRCPQRGGVLRFATRSDALGLDPHRYLYHPASVPLTATMQGLLDLNLHSEPVPGIAEEWEASPDLRTYTFKLRRGARFHNGREVDAGAIKWNFKRMQLSPTAHSFIYSALLNLQATEVVDRYTVRFRLHEPSAAFPANVVYYPCSLIAPDSFTPSQPYPVGCGPFRFVRWERDHITEVKRFADYYETDAAGNNLPYLDGILGLPRHVEQVRFMRLRSRQADLIETETYIDDRTFAEYSTKEFQLWNVPTLGTSYILFNLSTGPFTDHRLRQAAAHAIDHEMLKRVVFYSRGLLSLH
jgi:ABC-type transport system substrate-binding protein